MAICAWCGRQHGGYGSFCSPKCLEEYKAAKSYNGGSGASDSMLDAAGDIIGAAGAVLGYVLKGGAGNKAKKEERKRETEREGTREIYENASPPDYTKLILEQNAEKEKLEALTLEDWYRELDKIADEVRADLEQQLEGVKREGEKGWKSQGKVKKAQALFITYQSRIGTAVEKAKAETAKIRSKEKGSVYDIKLQIIKMNALKSDIHYKFYKKNSASEFSLLIRAIKEFFQKK